MAAGSSCVEAMAGSAGPVSSAKGVGEAVPLVVWEFGVAECCLPTSQPICETNCWRALPLPVRSQLDLGGDGESVKLDFCFTGPLQTLASVDVVFWISEFELLSAIFSTVWLLVGELWNRVFGIGMVMPW